ncbi:MAG: V-type ATP synthase subunit A [Pseudomonadota bacterium]|nr:V-type ATP synthase subunit A [Pseudomonadota bacterium]
MTIAEVFWINGPVLKARPARGFAMKEAVTVGDAELAAEVIRLEADAVTVQVYEDTTGMRPGAAVVGSGLPLALELGPGLLGRMFDGIQRPLDRMAELQGDFVRAGARIPGLDRERRWAFQPRLDPGSEIMGGEVIGEVAETPALPHRILLPPGLSGRLEWVADAGEFTVEQPIARVLTGNGKRQEISMLQRWPVRRPRPFAGRLPGEQPLLTGQRVLDTFFPVPKGGVCAMPGGFGAGKTILQQTIAKWCDADVIVYIGCGERGNEMAAVLREFPQLEDPRTGRRLLERTIIIANTSNMPVAARESSIYTGITMAEYYRDQGRHVALVADSMSRWAEALREISGRLEELPAEEGYPSYLPTRLAEFTERAGRVRTLAGEEGSLTVIGAISPPGGDFSEPVTAHIRRFVKTMWALDTPRAQARFYPAIHPLDSYSEYAPRLAPWWRERGGLRWEQWRDRMLQLLQQQARLERMIKIVGRDALPPAERGLLLCADVLVEGFLRQSAFSEKDHYCVPEKQAAMLGLIDHLLDLVADRVEQGIDPDSLLALPVMRRMKRMGDDIDNTDIAAFERLEEGLEEALRPEKIDPGKVDPEKIHVGP